MNNSRTQRPSVPKFGRKVPHLRCDSHTSFKVKRVTGPINADTHCASYLANAKAYKLTTYRWHPQVNTNLVYVRRSYSRSTVLSIDFNVFNWCSGHSVIADQCWIKYYCHRKVIITIFSCDNHRISKAITAHPFQFAKILSRPLILTHIVHHIFQIARPTNFELGIRMEDDDLHPHQPQAP